jgi:hypothetical protein
VAAGGVLEVNVSSRTRDGQAGPEAGKVPAAQARRRSRLAVTLALAGLAALWLVPALLLHPLPDPALLGFGTGVAVSIGAELVRNMANVRNPRQFPASQVRFLTVRTWTGPRTIDLRDLKRVRARRLVGRGFITDHIMITDGAGVLIAFADDNDRAIRLIKRALAAQMRRPPAHGPARISPAAAEVLETRPTPWWVSPVWTLAAFARPLLLILACAFTVIPLAAG